MKTSLFKNKNFFLLFQGTLTSNIAATFYSFALSFHILKITDNNAFLQGLYLGMCGLTFVIFSFVGGVLADRWNKVKIIYLSDFLKGGFILLSAIPLYFFIKNNQITAQLIIIFIVGFLNHVIAAIFSPASTALIPELVNKELLQRANSYFSMLTSFVSIIGIILAGLLYSYLSLILLFLMIGLLYIASGISVLFIKAVHHKKTDVITLKLMMNDFSAGIKLLWNIKPIFYIILGALFLNFFISPFASNLLPFIIKTDIANADYFLKDKFAPEMWLSIFSALLGLGSLIMALIIGSSPQKEKHGKAIKFFLSLIAFILVIHTVAYFLFKSNNINVFIIITSLVMLLLGVATIGVNIPISVTVQKNIPEGMLAKVSSVINIGSMGLTPFAALIAGALLNSFGGGGLFIFIAGGLTVVTVLIVFAKDISNI